MDIVMMTDNPNIPTGMAKVGREIANALTDAGHKVTYIGWCKAEGKNVPQKFDVIPVENASYGRDVFDSVILDKRPDIVLTIGDPWTYSYITDPRACSTRRLFQWIGYVAVDGESLGGGVPTFWNKVIPNMDRVIAYTEFGKNTLEVSFPELKGKIGLIYHGVDIEKYFPLQDEEIKKIRKSISIPDASFTFLVVARNCSRKNWSELFKAWKIIQEENLLPNARLWAHTCFRDKCGSNLYNMMDTFKIKDTQSIMYFQEIADSNGIDMVPEEVLSSLYNACDCLVSLGGEGFGLPVLEAMACGLPCIVLNNAATGELGDEGRALKVNPALTVTGTFLTERPVPNVNEIVKCMLEIASMSKEDKNKMTQKAYKFACENSWQRVGEQWVEYMEVFENPTSKPLTLEEV